MSLIPVPVAINKDRRYYPDSEDSFDAVTILKNRLERATPTVATRRALEFMDPDGHPPAASLNEGAGGCVEAPLTVVVTSPVEDWSGDFEFGSAEDKEVRAFYFLLVLPTNHSNKTSSRSAPILRLTTISFPARRTAV